MNRLPALLRVLPLLLLPVIFFITCQKEYSYEGGPVNTGSASGTAVYTFVGAGADCSGYTVSGNYYAGRSLDASNTVRLQVDVTTAGTYTLSTASVNGMVFSASGVFTNTGIQFIILTAGGTPTIVTNSVLSTPVSPGCTFTISVTTAPIAVAAYTLAGAPGDCTNANIHGDYFTGTSLGVNNTVDVTVNVTATGIFTLKTDTVNGISFSASGSFTQTGTQTVTLKGSGTPDLPINTVLTPQFTTSACTFTIPVLPPGILATYVLESGSGSNNTNPCVYTIQGSFTAGINPGTSNTVTIHAFSTTTGNFAVSTAVVNGIRFVASGTFTTPGSQWITLQAIGIPVAAGTFSYLPQIVGPHPLGGESCGFDITFQ
ncbi:MAG: hypothetical protein JST86_10375 [Bacteroidetes bacterium]|nr:hypothetical protein [Bacteroidota bacterium]